MRLCKYNVCPSTVCACHLLQVADRRAAELQAAWFRSCHAGSGHNVMLHHSVIAERRVALKFLDYALASGADSASKAKTEVDNTVTRTNEEVSPSTLVV